MGSRRKLCVGSVIPGFSTRPVQLIFAVIATQLRSNKFWFDLHYHVSRVGLSQHALFFCSFSFPIFAACAAAAEPSSWTQEAQAGQKSQPTTSWKTI